MVKWKRIDPIKIATYCEEFFKRYKEYPSVREIFYRFVDELWPNTKSVYKKLSKWLVNKRLSGEIDWRLIRDGSGREYEKGDWSLKTPRKHLTTWFKFFRAIGNTFNLPKWLNQPKKVIVVCEKEADYPIVKSILDDLNVDTFYERGYSGWRPIFETAERIKEEGKTPIIIALGDFDPSGEDIVRFLKDAFLTLKIPSIQVEKIMITKEQIEQFKLPHRPEDVNEIKKITDDPRFKKWPWGLYRVETAALRSKAPDYFDNTLREAVQKHFDDDVWKKVEERQEEGRTKIHGFFEGHEDLIEELEETIDNEEGLDEV